MLGINPRPVQPKPLWKRGFFLYIFMKPPLRAVWVVLASGFYRKLNQDIVSSLAVETVSSQDTVSFVFKRNLPQPADLVIR